MTHPFFPKIFTTLKGYTKKQFYADVLAGILVGIIALPLAIAFGIASGVTPEQGIITAVVAGFIVSLLGGSRVLIAGPTGAFVVIVLGIVVQHGVDGLMIATIMSGIILLLLGIFKIGSWIHFIPKPVILGFTAGIAALIFHTQLPNLSGYYPFLIALLTIALILLTPKITTKIPGTLIALICTSLLVWLLEIPLETVGSRFGTICCTLHPIELPTIDLTRLQTLLIPAITLALLGAIESLLCAVVADGMMQTKHRPNTELVAQGIANIITPFFGGIPSTGAIARTAANIRSGGRTPVAGMVHALVLFTIVVSLGALAGLIPMATLAGILVVVAYNMSEWQKCVKEIRSSWKKSLILGVTFLSTIFIDLIVAVTAGTILSLLILKKGKHAHS